MPNEHFSVDGTLIETEHLWDQARRGLAEKSGVSWPEEATRAMMGMSTREWSGYLADHVGIPMSPELAAQATIDPTQLQQAFDNVFQAMDEIDRYKAEAARSMKQTVTVLEGQVSRARLQLERSKSSDAATQDPQGS